MTWERVSALSAVYQPGLVGVETAADAGISLTELQNVAIVQIAAWPETFATMESWLQKVGEADKCPGPGMSQAWADGRLVRMEPLKWWALNPRPQVWPELAQLSTTDGVWTDLSHSRTAIRVAGPCAVDLLNRYLAVNLSDHQFRNGAVATGLFDHLPATVIRQDVAEATVYNLFVQRTYGEFFWLELLETAKQFGVVVQDSVAIQ